MIARGLGKEIFDDKLTEWEGEISVLRSCYSEPCKKNGKIMHRATAEAVAAPKTKRDRVAELHYITRGAQNVKDPNFEVS